MAKAKVRLKIRGVNQVMASRGAVNDIAARAQRIARAAGPNFEAVVKPHKWVARAYVRPKNAEGRAEEAREKKLTRAIDAGR